MTTRDFEGTTALIVGASGGLGGALATELAERGARLTMVGRDGDRLGSVAIDAHRVLADLRTPEACTHVVDQAVRANGPIDLLINAVGIVAFGGIEELGIDAMEDLFLTNTFVPIMLTKAALDNMAPDATIVQLSGVIAEQNLPGLAAYGASKAALRSFDEAMSRELRRRRIRVIDARPPHTETGLADHPIEGTAPAMPHGLDPRTVARVIIDAVAGTARDLPSQVFLDAAKDATPR